MFSKELEAVLKQDAKAKHQYADDQIRKALEGITDDKPDRKAVGEQLKRAAEGLKQEQQVG